MQNTADLTNLENLVSQQESFVNIQKLVNELNLPDVKLSEFDQGQTKYLFSYTGGFSFSFNTEKLSSIYLYGLRDKKFKPYKGNLPYQLTMNMSNETIVSKFGEPEEKQGGKVINISLIYNRLGIEFVFQSLTWEINTAEIDQIILFPKKADKIICGVCRKQSQLRCSQCKQIYYCGISCQKIHWPAHKKFCQ